MSLAQDATASTATIGQGGGLNSMRFTQNGNNNELFIDQGAISGSITGRSSGNHNGADVRQADYLTYTSYAQEGDANILTVSQNGNRSQASLTKLGTCDEITLS
ncbi:hypothetical protein ACFQDN_24530 [Pseudomonas asuensis]|nr:hypothetical protein [Pseudomonas asuensis]